MEATKKSHIKMGVHLREVFGGERKDIEKGR